MPNVCEARSARVRAARVQAETPASTRYAREDGVAMPRKQRLTWTVVLRLAVVVTGFAGLVVLGGGTSLLLVEGERPTALCAPGVTRSGGHSPP